MSVEGNKNAEKYSEEEAIEALEAAILLMLEDDEVKTQQHALKQLKLSRGLVSYWKLERFKDSPTVLDTIKRFSWISEDLLMVSGYDGAIPPNLCIFGAKAIHGWVEKGVELEVEATKNLVKIEFIK